MAITQKSIKILWASAAGRCAFSDCKEKLCTSEARGAAPYTVGEMAHIRGEQPGSNRHDPSQTPAERDDYSNLILLCPNHHTLVDKPENEKRFSVDVLQAIKSEHEAFVSGRLERPQYASKYEVAKFLYPLTRENHEVFTNFGPHSEIARKNPESDAHAVWLSERLSTIIPNNRRMAAVTEANHGLFNHEEQAILAKFELHVRTYDRWVRDEISYEGVVRFPPEFEAMILDMIHAGIQQ